MELSVLNVKFMIKAPKSTTLKKQAQEYAVHAQVKHHTIIKINVSPAVILWLIVFNVQEHHKEHYVQNVTQMLGELNTTWMEVKNACPAQEITTWTKMVMAAQHVIQFSLYHAQIVQ